MRSRYRLAAYLSGATSARMGDEMSGPALLLLALAITGSPAQASLVLAGLTISTAIGGPVLGAVLDRSRHPGRMLAFALVYYAAMVGIVGLLVGKVPLALVVAIGVAAGFAGPALTGGWTAQLAKVVRKGRLTRAYALDSTTYSVAGLVGPGLAGIVATWLGVGWAVVAAIALIVVAVPMAVGFRSVRPKTAAAEPLAKALPAGVKVIGARRSLLAVTIMSTVSFLGTGAFVVAVPLIGVQLTGQAALGTTLLSLFAAAALVGTAIMARVTPPIGPDRLAQLLTGVFGLALLIPVLTSWPPLVVAAFALAGLADGPMFVAVLAVRHREAPEHLHAQVFTTAASLKTGIFAVGAALGGLLAVHSVAACLLLAVGCQVVAVLAALVARVGERQEVDREMAVTGRS
ncbi:MFS transporter [Fodinicola acaciae]|uniref:MFS transporter n=1 Tax=Fodinicola acaciae TaxID=2681555 RepID=UPI0013D39C80|nr:MFS transporter [Fodinicola acaciae]